MIPLRSLYVTNAVLAALLACISYRTIDSFLEGQKPAKTETKKKEETPGPSEPQKMHSERYSIINEVNIFRSKDVAPTPPPPPPTPTPTPTPLLPKLELELKGTTIPIIGDMKAIIYNKKTRKTEYYNKGDVIPDCDGAKIIDITRTSVTVDRNGQIDVLELYPADQNPLKGGPKK